MQAVNLQPLGSCLPCRRAAVARPQTQPSSANSSKQTRPMLLLAEHQSRHTNCKADHILCRSSQYAHSPFQNQQEPKMQPTAVTSAKHQPTSSACGPAWHHKCWRCHSRSKPTQSISASRYAVYSKVNAMQHTHAHKQLGQGA